jgi:Uma2 family endonuclease
MVVTTESPSITWDYFLENPLERMEWINGKLVKKAEMTAKTGRIQARLAYYWRDYLIRQALGGEVYTETACRTVGRVRCPDVAYLLPNQVAEYGDFKILPHSFSLIAKIISPTDEAEEVLTKLREYLDSQCSEVWLIFPDSRWILIATKTEQRLLSDSEVAESATVLPGFKINVGELIA